jgi:hypothetical protein
VFPGEYDKGMTIDKRSWSAVASFAQDQTAEGRETAENANPHKLQRHDP